VFEAPELGRVRSGTDGTIAWEVSDLQGPRLLAGAEKSFAIRSSLIDAPARWRELYREAKLVGSATVDGVECWQLELRPETGGAETWYVDRARSLLVKLTTTMSHIMGEIPLEMTFSDYRPVGGVLLPFRSTQKALTQEVTTTFASAEANVDIPPEALAVPAEIRALLEITNRATPVPETPTPAPAAAPAPTGE
jgi:hypothetical protein